jgi:hypothetical protein
MAGVDPPSASVPQIMDLTHFVGARGGTKCRPRNGQSVEIAFELWISGGRDRRRSGDLTLFRRALYQLSYPTG